MNNFLYPIVNPKSVAFFGASNRFTAMGTNQLNALLDLGFEGKIYPVHPRERRVLGLKAYKKVQDLPEVPDLAVMVLPTHLVTGVVEECGQKGIKHADEIISADQGKALTPGACHRQHEQPD